MRRITLELVLGFALATALAVSIAGRGGDAVVARLEKQLAPGSQLVLIGNSMLEEGVDARALGAALGLKTSMVTRGGAASAWWYVVLKNRVLTMEPLPSAVVIGFRDTFLTQPTFRVEGQYGQAVRALSAEDEPALDTHVWRPALGLVPYQLNRHLALFRGRGHVQRAFDSDLHRLPAATLLRRPPGAVEAATRRVFDESRLRSLEVTRAQLRAERTSQASQFDFFARLEESLLPYISAAARQAEVPLVLVRIRRRANTTGGDSKALRGYIESLEAWAEAEGVSLLDFAGEERLTIDQFARGDHLGPAGRELFTRLLAKRLRPLLGHGCCGRVDS